MANFTTWSLPVGLRSKLVQLRKEKGFTQQTFAEAAGLHVNQIKRYEAGMTAPSLEGLKKIALTLHVSLDELVFNRNDREPDEGLKLQFEAITQLAPEDKVIIQEVLDGLILRYQAKRWIDRPTG